MIDALSYNLSQKLQALVSKPHITGEFFGPGRMSFWTCRGGGFKGYGYTPKEAYEEWLWVRSQ